MAESFVAIIMGSDSDFEVMRRCGDTLDELGITWEMRVASAHRTPARVREYVADAENRGAAVFVAAAGMAAHLAGVVAAETTKPVIAVPLASGVLDGLDALLSSVQMPPGVPLAVVSVGKAGAVNAALYAARVLALYDDEIREKLTGYIRDMERKVIEKDNALQEKLRDKG
ncbi:MAG: 5-(carboxyamino)imidazole ribonucleotide mutase [bacterium]|nr:5-(carboxyamino)imidazole ribonucleotide mutase [bacterium]